MAIFRSKTERFFVAVDSRVIRNGLLSLSALGLLTALLDRSDTWKFRLGEIARSLRLDEDRLAALFAELTEKGFVREGRDRYGTYYDLFSYPESPPVPTAVRAIPDRDPPAEEVDPVVPPPAPPLPPAPVPSPPPAEEPDPGVPAGSAPMTDAQREKWLRFIRERFPQTVKEHDLNEVIARR